MPPSKKKTAASGKKTAVKKRGTKKKSAARGKKTAAKPGPIKKKSATVKTRGRPPARYNNLTLADVTLQLKVEQVRAARRANNIADKELLPADEVTAFLSEVLLTVKQSIQNIPDSLAKLYPEKQRREARVTLMNQVDSMLVSLSDSIGGYLDDIKEVEGKDG